MHKINYVSLLIVFLLELVICEEIDVCTAPEGEFAYNGSQKMNCNFTRGDCETANGTLIIRLLEFELKKWPGRCKNGHSFKFQVGNSKATDICKLSSGDCFILQEAYYPCADLSALKNCSILKWRVQEPIYPVKMRFAGGSDSSTRHFKINYSYRSCGGSTGHEITTPTQEHTSTYPSALSTNSFTTQRKEFTNQNSNMSGLNEELTVDRILMIVFGILFLVTLVAATILAIRHLRLIKEAEKNDKEDIQRSSDPDPAYSVVNEAANRGRSSEQEIVVNTLYGMY